MARLSQLVATCPLTCLALVKDFEVNLTKAPSFSFKTSERGRSVGLAVVLEDTSEVYEDSAILLPMHGC